DEGQRRVVTAGQELVGLDLSGAFVDALEVDRALAPGLERLPTPRLGEVHALFHGDLLEGLEIDASPEFSGWLTAHRQRYRAQRVSVLSELAVRPPESSDELFRRVNEWLELAPFDLRAHEALIRALLKRGARRDADEHVSAALRAFEQEGLDS